VAARAAPLVAAEARALFAPFARAGCIALAVSGGPDSLALLWLAARWRGARKTGPDLIAFTVDHGLRRESAAEARAVAARARALGVPHRILRWRGAKPATGIQKAARQARYALMIAAAAKAGATHLLTAHTEDDQAETMLLRMARGSGLSGLGAMRPLAARGELVLARPFLSLSKARLVASLQKAGLVGADDASNRDPRFARVRWRSLMPALAAEGLSAPRLARLATRLARADAALEAAADAAEKTLVETLPGPAGRPALRVAASALAGLEAEIGLRLIGRLIARIGTEGVVELGKLETLFEALMRCLAAPPGAGRAGRFKRTLAGASVALSQGQVIVARTPPRRQKLS